MTERERRHLETLQKRARHLEHRIRTSDKDLSYDKQELSALQWATSFIAAALEVPA